MYLKQAEKGKQCQECKGFMPKPGNPAEGICNGNPVLAEGGCTYFDKKETKSEQA
jgi:hypothetical protein